MNADKGKSTSKFYHPFAALTRATEDTEEKREKTFKDLDLGLNPRTGSWFKISSVFIRVHLRLKKGCKLWLFSDCTSVSSVPRA